MPTPPLKDATLAIHGNRVHDSHTNAILFPICQSATFSQDTVGQAKGHSYSRVSNPSVDALEQAIAALEGTPGSVCFRTGMAAITALFLSVLKSGDHAVLSEVIYGGTVRLFHEVLIGLGVEATFVDTSDLNAVRAAIRPNTRILFSETPGNPTMTLTDIAAISAIAREHGLLHAVDNTFLTPLLQRPFDLGADISVLSTTKYIDGHNATVGGSLATHDEALLERFRLIRKTVGSIQAPFEAFLTLQGLKTLSARLRIHCENAQVIARWLTAHPFVERVYYPGLESFPQFALAQRQQRGAGGMLSFELKASAEDTFAVMNALRLCTRAESLGSVETLITHPASATHGDIPKEERDRLGISDRLIRLSVGLEAPEDIIADLDQAITSVLQGHAVAGGGR
ncbi:MAG TPA: aminotransferase class I/II-fold pyridoxal phosphate-dependent enzyme [Acidisarcina sp.]|nr:aminotransferase class I/II-fold pyridoxal phosphate-dependent enzyme [Acidisarcina sp.]